MVLMVPATTRETRRRKCRRPYAIIIAARSLSTHSPMMPNEDPLFTARYNNAPQFTEHQMVLLNLLVVPLLLFTLTYRI